jgi:hypothetical protein
MPFTTLEQFVAVTDDQARMVEAMQEVRDPEAPQRLAAAAGRGQAS